jgi:hypothetical protein
MYVAPGLWLDLSFAGLLDLESLNEQGLRRCSPSLVNNSHLR